MIALKSTTNASRAAAERTVQESVSIPVPTRTTAGAATPYVSQDRTAAAVSAVILRRVPAAPMVATTARMTCAVPEVAPAPRDRPAALTVATTSDRTATAAEMAMPVLLDRTAARTRMVRLIAVIRRRIRAALATGVTKVYPTVSAVPQSAFVRREIRLPLRRLL